MPQLPAPMAQSAQENASAAFSALEPGVYTARLAKVEATKSKSSDAAMWAVEFDKIKALDGTTKPGKQFTNLVLGDSSMWKVGQFFDAFGVPTSTNTDAMIGHRIRINVAQRVIAQGNRAGQVGNDISGFVMLDPSDEGYAEITKLQNKLGGGAAAAKPAAAKAAAPKAADTNEAAPAGAPADAEGGGEPEGGVDF